MSFFNLKEDMAKCKRLTEKQTRGDLQSAVRPIPNCTIDSLALEHLEGRRLEDRGVIFLRRKNRTYFILNPEEEQEI